MLIKIGLLIIMIQVMVLSAFAQTTEFTYQGSLKNGANPANGSYDFEFRAFTAVSGGSQVGSALARNGVQVADGIFAVNLDFGSVFTGPDRYIEISVRQAGGGALTALSPRQRVTSSPYAITSLLAQTATNATQLGGVPANQYVITTDPRMTDSRPPTPGSANYIQNGTTLQPSSSFNVGQKGEAEAFSSRTHYEIAGFRVLSIVGTGNLFAGVFAGENNTSGENNTFVGREAGRAPTTGSNNAFFGFSAGGQSTFGGSNSFFGANSGEANRGIGNSFFGRSSGAINTTGSQNAFFGMSSGRDNTVGDSNSFFGFNSGQDTISGNNNSFFGNAAGFGNTTGLGNSFFGRSSGVANITGSRNTILGYQADFASGDLSYATAIGAESIASQSNSIYLGRSSGADTVRIPGAVIIGGSLVVDTLGSTTGNVHLCRNTANRVSLCTSNVPPPGDTGETAELKARVTDQQKRIERQQEQIELLIKANQEMSKRILDIERQTPKGSQTEVKNGARK